MLNGTLHGLHMAADLVHPLSNHHAIAGMDQVGVTRRLRKATASIQLRNFAIAILLVAGGFVGWQQGTVLSQVMSFVAVGAALGIIWRFL